MQKVISARMILLEKHKRCQVREASQISHNRDCAKGVGTYKRLSVSKLQEACHLHRYRTLSIPV